MGRPTIPRRNYARDAQSLQRIIIMLQNDVTRSPEWCREQIDRLTRVIVAFNSDAGRPDVPTDDEIRQAAGALVESSIPPVSVKRKASR
jgi:hypothetical protein